MIVEQMEQLARTNDMGLKAMAIRLRAARMLTGLNQKEMASAVGISNTVLNNAEAAQTAPNLATMKYLFRAHRVDFNFILNGTFSHLPADVIERLFPALEAASREWDQKEGSGRAPARPKPSQSED